MAHDIVMHEHFLLPCLSECLIKFCIPCNSIALWHCGLIDRPWAIKHNCVPSQAVRYHMLSAPVSALDNRSPKQQARWDNVRLVCRQSLCRCC